LEIPGLRPGGSGGGTDRGAPRQVAAAAVEAGDKPVEGQESPKTGTVKRVRKVAGPAMPAAVEPKGE